jgi:hypothetical protein
MPLALGPQPGKCYRIAGIGFSFPYWQSQCERDRRILCSELSASSIIANQVAKATLSIANGAAIGYSQ